MHHQDPQEADDDQPAGRNFEQQFHKTPRVISDLTYPALGR